MHLAKAAQDAGREGSDNHSGSDKMDLGEKKTKMPYGNLKSEEIDEENKEADQLSLKSKTSLQDDFPQVEQVLNEEELRPKKGAKQDKKLKSSFKN